MPRQIGMPTTLSVGAAGQAQSALVQPAWLDQHDEAGRPLRPGSERNSNRVSTSCTIQLP